MQEERTKEEKEKEIFSQPLYGFNLLRGLGVNP